MTSRGIIVVGSKNKKMAKNSLKSVLTGWQRVALLIAVSVFAGSFTLANVHADQYDDQIKALQNENNAAQGNVNNLRGQAQSYQGAIDALTTQIYGLQAALNANLAHQADLERQISEAQTKLEQQRNYLSENIRAMYVEGQMSTIEELATSRNLSEYVDREEYRTSVQNKINAIIKEIAVLREQLQKQKQELEVVINTQTAQRAQLAAAQAEQQGLLAYNESQQAAYNAQISANSSKMAELRRQQIVANARFSGGAPGTGPTCGGGYPAKWCNIPMDSVIDSWGMYNRECVSYTAFKVAASGRYMPYWGGIGNAWQWAFDGWKYRDGTRAGGNYAGTTWHTANSTVAGIPTDTSPRAGDVAISANGAYGHAMYVESVNGDGTINISQYNASWDGRYSERNNVSTAGLRFIHF